MTQSNTCLSDIKIGQSALILSVGNPEKEFSTRLLELGLTKGSTVKVNGRAPFGDPMIILTRDCQIAIRKKDAKDILVVPK